MIMIIWLKTVLELMIIKITAHQQQSGNGQIFDIFAIKKETVWVVVVAGRQCFHGKFCFGLGALKFYCAVYSVYLYELMLEMLK